MPKRHVEAPKQKIFSSTSNDKNKTFGKRDWPRVSCWNDG